MGAIGRRVAARDEGAEAGPSRLPHPALRARDGSRRDRAAARAQRQPGEGTSAVRVDDPATRAGEDSLMTRDPRTMWTDTEPDDEAAADFFVPRATGAAC